MIHDLFISYSQRDKAIADAVCHSMEAASIRCWIAPRDIAHGKTWDDTIVDAITAAKLLVVILSTAANGSRIVLDEVAMALDAGLMVIPFRIEDRPTGALRLRIGRIHWVDAITPPLESRIGELVASVKHNLSTPKKTGENQPPQPESKRSHAADPKASETPALTAEPPVLASEQLNILESA